MKYIDHPPTVAANKAPINQVVLLVAGIISQIMFPMQGKVSCNDRIRIL